MGEREGGIKTAWCYCVEYFNVVSSSSHLKIFPATLFLLTFFLKDFILPFLPENLDSTNVRLAYVSIHINWLVLAAPHPLPDQYPPDPSLRQQQAPPSTPNAPNSSSSPPPTQSHLSIPCISLHPRHPTLHIFPTPPFPSLLIPQSIPTPL